jgi:hypothetical protein
VPPRSVAQAFADHLNSLLKPDRHRRPAERDRRALPDAAYQYRLSLCEDKQRGVL